MRIRFAGKHLRGGRTNRRGRFSKRVRVPAVPAGRYRVRVRVGRVVRTFRFRVTSGPERTGPLGAGPGYYVDAEAGSDSDPGTSPDRAWRSLARASQAPLQPGERLLLKRGSTFSGKLELSRSGTGATPIRVSSYGSGNLPRLTGDCVDLEGSYVVVSELRAEACDWAGVDVRGNQNVIEQSILKRNVAGVVVHRGASGNHVLRSTFRDNNRMSVLTPGGNDDSGAFAILVRGEDTEIAYNTISGSDTFSHDYGRDGAAVEIHGARRTHVHRNHAFQNDAFTELGDSRSADNTFAYNVVRSSLKHSIFLVTRGSQSGYGPVTGTRLYNNSVYLTGAASEGFVCHAGCGAGILTMRNNIIRARLKAGYADGPFNEDFNLYSGGPRQFKPGPHTFRADPGFVKASGGNLHLRAGSVAIDRGESVGYDRDFDGNDAPRDGDRNGSASFDLGAFEFRR